MSIVADSNVRMYGAPKSHTNSFEILASDTIF